MTSLTKKSQRTASQAQLNMNQIACLFLYAYLAASTLIAIPWVPNALNTIALYGFVAVGLVEILLVKRRVILSVHTLWYALFCVVCLCSSLYSTNMDIPIATTLEMVKILAFAFVAANILNSQKKIEICMATYSMATIVLYAYLGLTGQLVLEAEERLGQDLMGNANAFASVFMVAALFSVYFIFFAKRKIIKLGFLAVFCMQLHALALSGGRKNFILPLLMLCAMKLISTDKKGRKHLVRNGLIVVLILIVAVYAVFNVESLYNSIGYRMEGLISMVTGEGEVDASSDIRANMVQDALQLWRERPLFGNGINMFQKLSAYRTYSHNNYAELLCGLGVFGLIIYYAFYAIGLYKIFAQRHRGGYRWYWLLSLLCLLAFDLGSITYNMFMVQFLLVVCLIDTANKNKELERNI